MQCSACGADNSPTAKFCAQCGSPATAACPACGHVNAPGGRFCTDCGASLFVPASSPAAPLSTPPSEAAPAARFTSPRRYTPAHLAEKILTDRSAIEGERKLVTALFCDLVGSTGLAEALGPECMHDLLNRFFELALAEVHRFEGTLNQFLGDGFLALFGAPVAHEDHARRAALAALGIRRGLADLAGEMARQHGATMAVRMGLNTGLVVVGAIGDNLRMDYTAIGDTINVAARLQQHAEPGEILIGEATSRLASGYVRVEPLGQVELKGKSEPVVAYRLVGPGPRRSRVDVHAERGLSPLVGRERELQTLTERFAEARAGRGQVVFVSGDPGIGKSRLLHELRARLDDQEPTWLEGRCISYGQDISYLPIIDVLKDIFQIEESDDDAEIVRKAEAGARALGDAAAAGLPYLKFLLSVDPGDLSVGTMDPQLRKANIFEALRTLAEAGSAIRPLVIVLEDLHWVDRLSEEFISYLVEAVPRQRLLLVLTYRPGYVNPFGDQAFCTHLRLASLTESESAELARGMLEVESVPAELQRVVASKAEGNPFFVEEVLKSLVEVGAIRRSGAEYVLAKRIADIYVPDTIQDVIMARLDRLDEEPKRAIQTASVIGREFTVRLLDRTAALEGGLEGYLRELKEVELIYERALYPELAYMFKHALTHDVAYGGLLVARRKALHLLVGEAIEELYRDRLAEQYETLAYHYERAEAWDKALEYLQRSGEKAMAAFSPPQAATFYDRALAVVAKSGLRLTPEQTVTLHCRRGQALFLTNDWDECISSFRTMLDAAQEAGDRAQEGMALHEIAFASLWAHRFEDAFDYANRARRLAIDIDNQAVLAASLSVSSFTHLVVGELDEGAMMGEEAVRAAQQAGVPALQGFSLAISVHADNWRGNHARALERFDEALQIGRRHGVPLLVVWMPWVQGLARCGLGQYEKAIRGLLETLELSARFGEKIWRCRALNTLGWAYMDLCNWELAIRPNAQGAAESRELSDPEIIRNAELNLSDCYLALGQLDEAQRHLETVERESRRQGTWGETWMKWRYTQHLHASLGELWLARGDPERALDYADACLAGAEPTASRRNIVKGRRLKGEALLAQATLDEAETELVAALAVAREVGNPAQIWKTLSALARLHWAQGRAEDADAVTREAVEVVERVAANLADADLRETLLASPQVTALRQAAGVV